MTYRPTHNGPPIMDETRHNGPPIMDNDETQTPRPHYPGSRPSDIGRYEDRNNWHMSYQRNREYWTPTAPYTLPPAPPPPPPPTADAPTAADQVSNETTPWDYLTCCTSSWADYYEYFGSFQQNVMPLPFEGTYPSHSYDAPTDHHEYPARNDGYHGSSAGDFASREDDSREHGAPQSREEAAVSHSTMPPPTTVGTEARAFGQRRDTATDVPDDLKPPESKRSTSPRRPGRVVEAGDLVERLQDLDVVCGRGAPSNFHYGNLKFKELVANHQTSYLCAKRSSKPEIAMMILDVVKDRGGRFVRRKKSAGHFCWETIGDKAAYERVCQALREGAPELRRKMLAHSSTEADDSKTTSSFTKDQHEHTKDQRAFRSRGGWTNWQHY